MKKTTVSTLLAVISALALSSCGNSAPTATAPANNYPINFCVVSGKPLGSMGAPFVIDHGGTTAKLCCDGCLIQFNAEPTKYLAKLAVTEE